MKPAAALIGLVLAACAGGAPAFDPTGRWAGRATVAGRTTAIALNLRRDGGGWTGTMDLPEDRLLGKPLGPVEVHDDDVTIALPAHDGALAVTARLDGERLVGVARRGSVAVPLSLQRAPAAPLPYGEQPIAFRGGDGTILHGAMLRPRGRGPFPGVIFVHGSSTPGRDDYRYFADAYARRGFVALIYDKRDTGGSGSGGTASLETLAEDAVAAARALAARPEIAGVGYWGFSQGGWIAPLATQRFPFRFVAVGSAPAVSFADVTRYADDRRLAREGFSQAERRAAIAAQDAVNARVRRGEVATATDAALAAAHRNRWAARTTLPRRLPNPAERSRLRWVDLDFDPLPAWHTVRAPVFVAYGEADEDVPAAASARLIAQALRASRNRTVTVRGYANANHNLAPAPTYLDDLLAWSVAAARSPEPSQ